MTDRIARKDIRRDEFMETMEKGVAYTQSHVRTVLTWVGALVAVIALGWGVWAWRNSTRLSANDALAGAMKVWNGGVDAAAPKPEADPPTFASEGAKRQRAQELFQALVKEHGGSTAGDVGKLYLASIAIEQGQAEPAREFWKSYMADHQGDMLAASVQLDLLRLDRGQGKADQVAVELRRLSGESQPAVPLDTLLYELARTLDQQGKTDDARTTWQRIADEFPRSPYAAEAQRFGAAGGAGGARPARP